MATRTGIRGSNQTSKAKNSHPQEYHHKTKQPTEEETFTIIQRTIRREASAPGTEVEIARLWINNRRKPKMLKLLTNWLQTIHNHKSYVLGRPLTLPTAWAKETRQ
jgi:hypothetical protein